MIFPRIRTPRRSATPCCHTDFRLDVKFLQKPLDSPGSFVYSRPTKSAQIAQLVEQRIENPRVAGSIPALGTIKSFSPFVSSG